MAWLQLCGVAGYGVACGISDGALAAASGVTRVKNIRCVNNGAAALP